MPKKVTPLKPKGVENTIVKLQGNNVSNVLRPGGWSEETSDKPATKKWPGKTKA